MEKSKLPSLVTVLILTLITAVMWVGFDVYRLFNRPAAPSVPKSVSAPLSPVLDRDTINQIESRLFLNDSQIPDNVANTSPNPTSGPATTNSPIPTPTTASGSGTAI